MPIHLNSVNRRTFLLGAMGAGGSVLGGRMASAALIKTTEARSWALLSDPHVAGDLGRIVRGACMAKNLHKVVAEVINREAGAGGVIVNGDCAHLFGKREDYENFAGLVDPLADEGRSLHLLMGNHDDRDVFAKAFSPESREPVAVGGRHTTMIESPLVNWFLLDSKKRGRWVKGEIGKAQTAWLARMLDLHPEKPAIVMTHHQPQVLAPGEKRQRNFSGLIDSEPFLELLRSRRQVKALIFGHTHRWNVSRDVSGLYLINLPPVGYLFNLSRPNGWVHATLGPDRMELELCALERKHPEQGERHSLKWRV